MGNEIHGLGNKGSLVLQGKKGRAMDQDLIGPSISITLFILVLARGF